MTKISKNKKTNKNYINEVFPIKGLGFINTEN